MREAAGLSVAYHASDQRPYVMHCMCLVVEVTLIKVQELQYVVYVWKHVTSATGRLLAMFRF